MRRYLFSLFALMLAVVLFKPDTASAHCDGLDGPVVTAAIKALDTNNVNLILIWVQPDDEANIKAAFDHTIKVRKLGAEAKELADMYFFETLVRVHRAGEGAPYTGIKPAGRDLGPAIPAADESIESGSPKEVLQLLNDAVHGGLHTRFMEVQEKKNYDKNDVKAGRDFVKAYVEYIHYVEPIYETATKAAGHGHAEAGHSEGGAGAHQH